MGSQRGSIPERVKRALYVLSRGRCYAPVCSEPVVVIEGDEAVFVGTIAHIIAASPGGPRGNHLATNLESFANLIILCGKHHKIVDSIQTRKNYPPEVLRRWKQEREAEFDSQALSYLNHIDPARIPALLATSFKETTRELSATVDRLEKAGHLAHDTASLFREAVERAPALDSDFHYSARTLGIFVDALPNFDRSAQQLGIFADSISGSTLNELTNSLNQLCGYGLSTLEELVSQLRAATINLPSPDDYRRAMIGFPQLEELSANVEELRNVSQEISRLAPRNTIPKAAPRPQPSKAPARVGTGTRNLPLKLAIGAFLIGLAAGAIAVAWFSSTTSKAAEEDRQSCTGAKAPPGFVVTRQVKVKATPSVSPSPYVCPTWYPQPIPNPTKR
ncbi:hypothetical protein AB0H63_30915 [Micromonospora echinospora]|uniref:hypothetical protein n=1 Tax=Micromonospora echinospora TaxID=1877 RepID=UPI0033FC8AC1